MAKSQVIHVQVEPKMKAVLTQEAKALGTSVGFVIRAAIKHWLKSKEQAA